MADAQQPAADVHAECGRWVSIANGGHIPINRILLTWNGDWLSAPCSFKNQKDADGYRDEWNVVAYLIIPDARKL